MTTAGLKSGMVALLVLFIAPATFAGEKNKTDYSKALSLRLSYRSAEGGAFVATLKNTSKEKLHLLVATDELRGKFSVDETKGGDTAFYDKDYLRKLLTGVLIPGSCKLEPDKEIQWTVRLDDLVFFRPSGKLVTAADLVGKSVSLELEHLSASPGIGKSSVPLEAKSNVVQIPPNEQKAGEQPAAAPAPKDKSHLPNNGP